MPIAKRSSAVRRVVCSGCRPQRNRDDGVARTIFVGFTVAAVVAIAQTHVNRSDRNAEATAIGALRAISSAQSNHVAVYGGYARSLHALSTLCPAVSTGFISPDL